jgi:hypothetical protein
MNIKVTTDPITMRELDADQCHPCIYEGDGDNGVEIYFENEFTRDTYLYWYNQHDSKIVLQGNDSADYIAEG